MELKFNHSKTKVQQMADYIRLKISVNEYKIGQNLPSINYLSRTHKVSRDTVFKSFLILRESGIVDSIHGKNYYVTKQTSNVFLLLDEYSPFKESLYNALVEALPESYKVDLWFHQYNQNLFNTILNESLGKYSKYLVMNYDNEKISDVLNKIDKERLLLLDFGKFNKKTYAYVCQDFDENFYNALQEVGEKLQQYKKLVFVFNKKHKHPQSSKVYFEKFCIDHAFDFEVIDRNTEKITIQKGECYIVIKQHDVVNIIKQARQQKLHVGTDIGMIAYNENPFYEVLCDGISSISIDFKEMGKMAANFVLNGEKIQTYIPTKVNHRNSI